MIAVLVWTAFAVLGLSVLYAWRRWHDLFHPLMIIGPMLAFLYWYLPLKLLSDLQFFTFFNSTQILFVQTLNLLGVIAFVAGCNIGSGKPIALARRRLDQLQRGRPEGAIAFATLIGTIGLTCWWITVQNTGGLTATFSSSYNIGWSDNGYIRDAAYLLFSAIILLVFTSPARKSFRISRNLLVILFASPWIIQAILGARRGPLFEMAATLGLAYFLSRARRPKALVFVLAGLAVGYLMLFLLTNRSQIYLGSDFDLTTDVSSSFGGETGNEFIYGTGVVLHASESQSFYWGKRYLAYLVIRPIPSIWWPTKYEDVGLADLLHNAGTARGGGIDATLGWKETEGAAPGIVADLWVEMWWLAVPAMWILGYTYGRVWRKGVLTGGIWAAQYVVLVSLTAFLILQTMEAVIVRCLLISAPLWFTKLFLNTKKQIRLRPNQTGVPRHAQSVHSV